MPTSADPNFRGRDHTCHTHAVASAGGCDYIYDSNGNIVRRDRNSQYEFTAAWNSFNKPTSVFAGLDGSEFEYSVDGRRTKQLIFEGTNVTKKVYATPAYEIKETLINPAETNRANWQWEMDFVRIYVDTPSGKIGIYEQEGSTNGTGSITRSYIHKDHLGSVVAVSDDSKNITHYSFDAWGNRRDASDWSTLSTFNHSTLSTDRGYTGHEMLDHLDLVHMNGRIYDPVIGRMISPDPLIQAPENLQSFNRYSYVFNNPLTNVDPSGFETKSKKSQSEAATASTQLSENVSSTEISSQDNVGGSESSSSQQVDDYYTDGSGNTQVDQTTQAATHQTGAGGEENLGSTAGLGDKKGYGTGEGTATQHTVEDNAKSANSTLATIQGDTGKDNSKNANGANSETGEFTQGVKNFFKGVGSYFRGLGRAMRYGQRTKGRFGKESQKQANLEGKLTVEALKGYFKSEQLRNVANDFAKNYISNNKARTAGRVVTGSTVTAGLTYIGGPAGSLAGALLSGGAVIGDAMHGANQAVEAGKSVMEGAIESAIGGETSVSIGLEDNVYQLDIRNDQ